MQHAHASTGAPQTFPESMRLGKATTGCKEQGEQQYGRAEAGQDKAEQTLNVKECTQPKSISACSLQAEIGALSLVVCLPETSILDGQEAPKNPAQICQGLSDVDQLIS